MKLISHCSRCGADKPAHEFGQPLKSGRLRSHCKSCRAEIARATRKERGDHVRAVARARRVANLEKLRAQDREQYARNPEPDKTRQREYRKKFPAKVAASRARTFAKHGKEYQARFLKKHRNRILAQQQTYRANNRQAMRDRSRQWRKRNPDKLAAQAARKRARKLSLQIGDQQPITAFYKFVKSAARIKCYWCKRSTRKGGRQVDHILPLSAGGAHAIWNLCCACTKCNQRKHTSLPEQFSGQHEIAFLGGGAKC